MPAFISYSHENKSFVEQLAVQLVVKKVPVWFDKWEMHAGDSLLNKIQKAISGASALLVVLSKASVKSEWCNKELNAGLMRELKEKRILVLPILLEDCGIPLFLQEKMYADFRSDFDDGLATVLESIARISNASQGRIEDRTYLTDWSIETGVIEGHPTVCIKSIDHHTDVPYSVLGETNILALDVAASNWFIALGNEGKLDYAQREVVTALADSIRGKSEFEVMMEDAKTVDRGLEFGVHGHRFVCGFAIQRLGTDTGRPVLFRIPWLMDNIVQTMWDVARNAEPPPEEPQKKSAAPESVRVAGEKKAKKSAKKKKPKGE